MKALNRILKIIVLVTTTCFHLEVSAQSAAAIKHFDEGRAYSDKDENDLAISSFTEAIKLFPEYYNAYNWRGFVFYKKMEYDIAIIDFKESIRLNAYYANTHRNLARAYERKGNFDLAIKELNEAIRLEPQEKNGYRQLGDLYYRRYDYALAISIYNEIIRLDPKDATGYNSRANVYFTKGEYDKAIIEYEQIIRLNSSNHTAYFRRGNAYKEQKLFDLAIKDYNEAMRINPKEPSYYKERGDAYKEQKLFDLAIKDYNEAMRINPKEPSYYKERGDAYKDKGDTALAIKDYNENVRISGKPESLVERAWFYFNLKKYELALNDFSEAVKIDPKYVQGYVSRGVFYRNTDQYDLALEEYAKALQIDPKSTSALVGRGNVQKAKGFYQLAIADFETVLSINPEFTLAYIHILSPLIRTGQFAKAKEYVDKHYGHSFFDRESWQFYKYYLSVISNDLPAGQYDNALINLDKALLDYSKFSKEDVSAKSGYINILALKGYVLEKLSRYKEAKQVYEQTLVINSLQPDVKEALIRIEKGTAIIAGNDNTPPEIQLISPQTERGLQIVSATNKTEIIGKAKDASGIASVTVNGKAITKMDEDGLFVSALSLSEGVNSILITAIDKKGNAASKTFTLTGNIVAKKQEPEIIIPITTDNKAPQYHAILIAAKDYVDPAITDLENPVKDAAELKSILENNYTFTAANIETLYNKSREEIMQALVLKSNSLTENDNLLIFYAGHGIAEKDKFGDVDGYWIPSSAKKGLNASYISADDINKALKRSNSKHILVIADACFSGAFTRQLSADASVGVQKQYSVPSRKIMASGNLEPVPDNSRFVYYLKKNLKENKEKYLTAKKLFDSFYEAILNNSETSPQYAAIKNVGDEGGEFVFIKK